MNSTSRFLTRSPHLPFSLPRTSAERHKRSWGLAEFKAVVRTRRGSGLPGRIPQGSPRHPCRTRASNPVHHPSVLFFPIQCKQEHHAPGTTNPIFRLFRRNREIPSASLRMGDSKETETETEVETARRYRPNGVALDRGVGDSEGQYNHFDDRTAPRGISLLNIKKLFPVFGRKLVHR
ncbi:hypothetical protein BHE74_00014846 [Ensete ventricosum]|nr:hypothetical protein GW17_00026771 [Ensete ventricosum]RWW77016.1 hypothetical protein BHE74_00014846 [Ensete ventricosum]